MVLFLCCVKTYGAMKNPDDRDYDRDNDGKEDENNNGNAASRSGSNGPIFDLIALPRSYLGCADYYWTATKMSLRPQCHIYLRIGIYLSCKYPMNTIVNMCHKLMYAKN